VRKTHNSGRKHKEAVKLYYQNWVAQQAETMMANPGEWLAGLTQMSLCCLHQWQLELHSLMAVRGPLVDGS